MYMLELLVLLSFLSLFTSNSLLMRPLRARLYLIRHAETIANRAGILQGHCDYPLTPEGDAHSRALGELLKDKLWDKVYCSDLQRALTSAHNILSKSMTGSHIDTLIQSNLLREVNFGVREGLPRGITVADAIAIKAAQLKKPIEEIVDTAESPEEVKERQIQFLAYLREELQEHRKTRVGDGERSVNVVCITHGAFIRNFLSNFVHIKQEESIGNCSVTIIDIEWNSEGECSCKAKKEEVNLCYSSTYIP